MNVGQILETHLGWACSELGEQIKNSLQNFENKINENFKTNLKKYTVKNFLIE